MSSLSAISLHVCIQFILRSRLKSNNITPVLKPLPYKDNNIFFRSGTKQIGSKDKLVSFSKSLQEQAKVCGASTVFLDTNHSGSQLVPLPITKYIND